MVMDNCLYVFFNFKKISANFEKYVMPKRKLACCMTTHIQYFSENFTQCYSKEHCVLVYKNNIFLTTKLCDDTTSYIEESARS